MNEEEAALLRSFTGFEFRKREDPGFPDLWYDFKKIQVKYWEGLPKSFFYEWF